VAVVAVEAGEEAALEQAVDWGRQLSCIQVAQGLCRTDRGNCFTAVAPLSTVTRKIDDGRKVGDGGARF